MAKRGFDQKVASQRRYQSSEEFYELYKNLKLEDFQSWAVQIGAVRDTDSKWDYAGQILFENFPNNENPCIKRDFALAIVDTQLRWGRTLMVPVIALEPGMIIFNFQTGINQSDRWDFVEIFNVKKLAYSDRMEQPERPSLTSSNREDWDNYLKKFRAYSSWVASREEFYQVTGFSIGTQEMITKLCSSRSLWRIYLDELTFVQSTETELGEIKVNDRFWNLERNLIQEVKSIQVIFKQSIFTLVGKDKDEKYYHDRCLESELRNKRYYERYTNQTVLPMKVSAEGKGFAFRVDYTSTERSVEIGLASSLYKEYYDNGFFSMAIHQTMDTEGAWRNTKVYFGSKEKDDDFPCWELEAFYRHKHFASLEASQRQSSKDVMSTYIPRFEQLQLLSDLTDFALELGKDPNQFFSIVIQIAIEKNTLGIKSLKYKSPLAAIALEYISRVLLAASPY